MSSDNLTTSKTAHYIGSLSWKFALCGFVLLIFSSLYKSVLPKEYNALIDFLMGAIFINGAILTLICVKLCIKDGFHGVKKSIMIGSLLNIPMILIFIPNLMVSSSKGMTKEQAISFGIFMACENLNKECPKLIGDNVRMDCVASRGNEISYSYTILGQSDDEILKAKNNNVIKFKSQSTSSEFIKRNLDSGIKMRYEIKNEKGIIMYDVVLSK